MIYDSNEIMKVLPHRYPFLLVDKITELEVGVRAKGIKCVSVNEMHFLGHFPTKHVMPGVLIIEALAQVGAFALLSKPELKGKLAYFAGIKEARFKQMVIPGDVLELETTLTKIRGSIGFGHAVAKVNEQVVCQAELIFAIEQ